MFALATVVSRLRTPDVPPHEFIPTHFVKVAIHSFGAEEVAELKRALVTVYEHLNQLESEITLAVPLPLERSRGDRKANGAR
jgi:hypothetical protein